MAAKLTPMVMRRIAGECTDVDEHGAVGIRLEPAAAIDENQDGTRGSNLLCSANEFAATACPAACRKRAARPSSDSQIFDTTPGEVTGFSGGAPHDRGRPLGWRPQARRPAGAGGMLKLPP